MSGTLGNIKVEPCQVLFGEVDVGFTEGELGIKPAEKFHDIKAHQQYDNVIGAIRVAKSAEVTINLQETSTAQIKTLIGYGGASLAAAVAEVYTITCVADVASSLQSTYFLAQTADNAALHYFWFNVSSGGVDPAIAGRTGHAVAITAGATASAVATALATAMAVTGFGTPAASGAVVTVTLSSTGGATDPSDGAAATGFTFAVTTQGADAGPGWGTSMDGVEVSGQCKPLRFHPVASGTDYTRDLTIWKCYPELDGIKKSPTNPLVFTAKFRAFPDLTRDPKIAWFFFGKSF
jgi:hypothetical protein